VNECWRTKIWMATAAKAGLLPEVPTTPPRVTDFAKREGLKTQKIKGPGLRGGRREYDISPLLSKLRPDQQLALSQFYKQSEALPAVAVTAGADDATVVPKPESPTGARPAVAAGTIIIPASQADMDAAIARYEAAGTVRQKKGEHCAQALKKLDLQLKAGIPAMVAYRAAAAQAGLGLTRIRELWDAVQGFDERLWPAVATPGHESPKSFVDANPTISNFAKGLILERRNQIADAKVWEVTQANFDLPDHRRKSFERWCRRFRDEHKVNIVIATASDRSRSHYQPAHGRIDDQVTDFLQIVELDGSPCDVMTIAGKRRRFLIMADVYTRLACCIVAPAESALATGRLIVKFQRQFGLPRTIRTDHGSGFISEQNRLFLARVGVEVLEIAPVYTPQRKPIAESTVHEVQRFCALMPGALGRDTHQRQALRDLHSMAARRGKTEAELLGAQLTEEQIEKLVDDYLDTVFAHRPHGGLPHRRSPNAQFLDWVERGGTVRRIEDEEPLYALLSERGNRIVVKRGVQLERKFFIAPQLGRFPNMEVEYRRLPSPSEIALYTTGRPAQFIAKAVANSALTSEERRERAVAVSDVFREHTSQVRKAAKTLKALIESPAEILLNGSKTKPRIEIAAVRYTTPDIEATREGQRMIAAMEVDQRAGTGLFSDAPMATPVRDDFADEPLSVSERLFEDYKKLIQRRDAGDQLSTTEEEKIRVYESSIGYRVRREHGLVA
jgi:hypothetical protein